MKKLTSIITLLIFAHSAGAATSITTPTVSGHWTLAGSPYHIYNNIKIATDSSLTIDPGVMVFFQGCYTFYVFGMLHAEGTSVQQITFTIQDTTGWSTDTLTSTGGWGGLQIQGYFGTASDTSALQYCNISYVKIDSPAWSNQASPLVVQRPLAIRNCNIFNNKSLSMYENYVVLLAPFPAGPIEFGNCNVYNNDFHLSPIVYVGNASGGSTYFHNNNIYKNKNATSTLFCGSVNMVMENNNLFQNNSEDGTLNILNGTGYTGVYVFSHATIKGNKFYENTNTNMGAIHCDNGFIDINENLICNNQHTISGVGACGLTNAAGGIFLEGYANLDSTSFIVRNNIIANNYSPDWGGGIEVLTAKATIINNIIINNKAQNGGGIWIGDDSSQNVIIKNNVFYGNENINSLCGASNVVGYSNGTIEYDHNWTQYPFYRDLNFSSGVAYSGDTATNVIGVAPGLVAPTLTPDVTENAVTANFALSPTSSCINKGDTTGVSAGLTDYAGNPRIYGSSIDIGAYEFNPILYSLNTSSIQSRSIIEMKVYPNPASDILFISTPESKGTIELQDVTSKHIAAQQVTSVITSFDIHALPRGIYFLVWNDGQGGKSVQKVVVD